MIEPLTKAKLIEYEFSETQIERLFTWDNYQCAVISGRGYLWASNTEMKIYSGIEGKEKHFAKSILPIHHKEPKEKFETFDQLFFYAVQVGSIEKPKSKNHFSTEKVAHNFSFNVWLQNCRGWEYGDDIRYRELLTRGNWVAYLEDTAKEAELLKQKGNTLKALWTPKKASDIEQKTNATSSLPLKGHLNEFIREVQSIEIRIKEYYIQDGVIFLDWTPDEIPDYNLKKAKFFDLSHYDQRKSDYENKIRSLQQLALTEALSLNKEELIRQVSRLEQIAEDIVSFWKIYQDWFNNRITQAEFEFKVKDLLILEKPHLPSDRERYNTSYSDKHDWHDALMLKNKYLRRFIEQVKKIIEPVKSENPSGNDKAILDGKPAFKPEVINEVFNILKDFFSVNDQEELKMILESGGDSSKPLLFKDNGNRLADAFKQLKQADLITGCQKKELEAWIAKNFQYLHRNERKHFKPKYLNDIISTDKDKCQKPLLNVVLDKTKNIHIISKV
jgi:hypothetical protein